MMAVQVYRASLEHPVDPQQCGPLGPALVVRVEDYDALRAEVELHKANAEASQRMWDVCDADRQALRAEVADLRQFHSWAEPQILSHGVDTLEIERLRSQFANSEGEVERLKADKARVDYCQRYILALDFDYGGNGDCALAIELPKAGRYPAHFREAIDEAIRLSPPTGESPT